MYPVIKKIQYQGLENVLKQKGKIQTMFAMESLHVSGQRSGYFPEKLQKGENGQPQPCNGVFWSISHKEEYAAGLVSKIVAGIDLEKIKDISPSVFERVVEKKEKQCFVEDEDKIIFFRCFTAKEAVLKAVGIGLSGLSGTDVINVKDHMNLLLKYKSDEYKVEHIFFDNYIASIVKGVNKINFEVEWQID